jgi:hypothetical protein
MTETDVDLSGESHSCIHYLGSIHISALIVLYRVVYIVKIYIILQRLAVEDASGAYPGQE